MSLPPIEWIVSGPLTDEGFRTAVFPYNKLRSIRGRGDCRLAALEESSTFEAEFGLGLVRPFYDILWYLNTRAGILTSHSAFSTAAFRPNGQSGIAAHIVFLSRDHNARLSLDANMRLLQTLGTRLANCAFRKDRIKGTDHWIRLLPVYVDYWCRLIDDKDGILVETPAVSQRGYGCQIEICAMAAGRRPAAEIWSKTCMFVLEAAEPPSQLSEWGEAAPFDLDQQFLLSESSKS